MSLGTLITVAICIVVGVFGARATWNYVSGNSSGCDGCTSCKSGGCQGNGSGCSAADKMVCDMEKAACKPGSAR